MSTNVYLAECSHSNAQIKKPGCNTYFTNRIGDGIQVDVGDQISFTLHTHMRLGPVPSLSNG